MVLRFEVDGEDFESGKEIFLEKTRSDAEYRYCGGHGGLRRGRVGGRAWTVDEGKSWLVGKAIVVNILQLRDVVMCTLRHSHHIRT